MARLRTAGWETRRLTAGSAKTHGDNEPGGTNSVQGIASLTVGTINTAVPRSGQACLEVTSTGQGDNCQSLGAVLGRAFYQRIGFRFTATQSTNIRILEFDTAAGAKIGMVVLRTDDALQLQDFNFGAVGSNSPALTHDHWYRLEFKAVVHAVPTASNGIVEARLYDDTTGLLIWNPSSSSADLSTTAIDRAKAGNVAAATIVGSIFFDDWAVNDDQGANQNSWPGDGKVVLLKPISDNARVGWTAGAGATTSLFEAVNNLPPVGVVTASATDASQIKDANNNNTDTYDANVAAYSTAVASGGGGIASGDVVTLVQAVARMGNSTTTARNVAVNNLSNPAGSERTDSNPAVAAATDPTGWYSIRNVVQYAPSVTQGTSPVVRVRKATASTDVANVDLMGLYVEYRPLQTGTASVSGSGSVAATGQRDARAAASLAGQGSISAAGTRIATGAASLSGVGSVGAAGLHTAIGVVSVSGSGAISATGLRDARATASLAGTGTLAGTGQRTALGGAVLAGQGSLSASGTPTHFGVAELQGQGSLAAIGLVEGVASAALSGSGIIGASGVRQTSGAAALSGAGSVAASGTRSTTGGAALAGAGSVAGSGRLTTFSGAGLSGAGTLAATGTSLRYGSAALLGSGILVASGRLTVKGAASLAGAGTLVATGHHNLGHAPWFVGPIDMEPIHLDSEIDLVR